MAILKAFKGIRPVKEKINLIAARPYDVLNKNEARKESEGNPYSYLHVTKPEIDLPDDVDQYAPEVYKKGAENFKKLLDDGIFVPDDKEYLYIYAQTMEGRTQYGIVGCAGVEDFMNNVILHHEKTLPSKVEERKNHIRASNVNYEPVFFTYPAVKEIDEIVASVVKEEPEYDFITDEGFGHHFWVIRNQENINRIIELFAELPNVYIADGHHRTTSAALIGNDRKENNPKHKGNEEYNFFLTVNFPDNQLHIIDYNRVVKDLNNNSEDEFFEKLKDKFIVEEKGEDIYKPINTHNFSMYFKGKWYSLTTKKGTFEENNPIGCLDVSIMSDNILNEILGIDDLRKSKRIDFVGGIRGLGELKHRVDNGEMAVAFALYPVSIAQLFDVADSGCIMPPKTTWFEPKLRSGLVVHSLED